jgi:hypothetical protein
MLGLRLSQYLRTIGPQAFRSSTKSQKFSRMSTHVLGTIGVQAFRSSTLRTFGRSDGKLFERQLLVSAVAQRYSVTALQRYNATAL